MSTINTYINLFIYHGWTEIAELCGTLGLLVEKFALVFTCGFQQTGATCVTHCFGSLLRPFLHRAQPRAQSRTQSRTPCHAGALVAGHTKNEANDNRPAYTRVPYTNDPLELYLSIAVNALAPFSFPVATLGRTFGCSFCRRAIFGSPYNAWMPFVR